MSIETPFEAYAQFPETGRPCMRAFHNLAMTAELVTAL